MPVPPSEAFVKPAEVASVENAEYPPSTTAGGVVVLDLSLTEKGQLTETGALHDIPALTAAAAAAVQTWKFKPASATDMSIPSAMTVAFVYRPPVSIWNPPPFSAALPNPSSSTNAAIPAGVLSVAYADYPPDSVASGAVIVQVALDTSGKIDDMKILRGMGDLNRFALAAAKDWKFQAAQFQGEAVKSNVVIAFVFAPPVVTP
jgi:TonB family protein